MLADPELTPIPLDLDPLWRPFDADVPPPDGSPEAAATEGGPELEHYDLFADALVAGGEGGDEGGDPDTPRPVAPVVPVAGIVPGPRKAAPLLTLEEAQARLPDGVKERLTERLKANFREVRRYRPRIDRS